MRLDVIVRCMQTIDALRCGPISAQELAEKMGVSRRTAYRYLDAASCVLPVVNEDGKYGKYCMMKVIDQP